MYDSELVGIFIGAGIAASVILLAFYLLDAFVTYSYFKVRNYPGKWMAFIPIANTYGVVEATYGKQVDKIRLFGLELPAILVKLFPLVLSVVSGVASCVPGLIGIMDSLVAVVSIAFATFVYIDVMKRIDNEVSIPFAILANLISIVGSIKLLMVCKGLEAGQYSYDSEEEVLPSQKAS